MERKKGIPLVALVIFIALLVAIILTCVIILGANKKGGSENKGQESPSNTTNQTGETPVEPVEDKGETIEDEDTLNQDEEIKEAYKLTGNGKTFAKYAVYSSGGFNTDDENLKNDLKLQLAMAQVSSSDMDKSSSTKSVSKEKVEEYAKKIFENSDDIEYKDFSLYGSDTNFTEVYKTIGYIYNPDKETYEFKENDVTEDVPSEITEVITKAVKYNDKIEIYVKPLFVQTFYSEQIQGTGCEIYADYNFQSKEYLESFIAIAYSDYEGILRTEYNKDLDGYKYSEVSSNIDLNKVKDYKYTFVKTDDGYKLKSFEKTEATSNKPEDVASSLDEQEKGIFNSTVEKYVGEGKKATDIKSLLREIAVQNEIYADDLDRITEVTVDQQSAKLEENDVNKLNKDIEDLIEDIDSSSKYTVKATYKAGVIVEVIITKE